jgi:hypothetical protein
MAQIPWGAMAALVALYLKGNPTVEAGTPNTPRTLIMEFSFALRQVVLNVATAKGTSGN